MINDALRVCGRPYERLARIPPKASDFPHMVRQ